MPNRIKELRDARGLTLEQVAEGAETSFQQIARLETGERRLTDEWMRRIAKAIGVHPSELLSDTLPDINQLAKQAEDALVLRWWHMMDLSEKRMIAAIAKDKGIEILANKPKRRPRRSA